MKPTFPLKESGGMASRLKAPRQVKNLPNQFPLLNLYQRRADSSIVSPAACLLLLTSLAQEPPTSASCSFSPRASASSSSSPEGSSGSIANVSTRWWWGGGEVHFACFQTQCVGGQSLHCIWGSKCAFVQPNLLNGRVKLSGLIRKAAASQSSWQITVQSLHASVCWHVSMALTTRTNRGRKGRRIICCDRLSGG